MYRFSVPSIYAPSLLCSLTDATSSTAAYTQASFRMLLSIHLNQKDEEKYMLRAPWHKSVMMEPCSIPIIKRAQEFSSSFITVTGDEVIS